MNDDELISPLEKLQLTDTPNKKTKQNKVNLRSGILNSMADDNSVRQWPKWSGDPSDFPVFQISLEGIADGYKSSKSFCYQVFSNSLPTEAQKRVAPWMKQQKLAQEWDIDRFLSHLEDLFVDNDAPSRAQAKLYAIRQGPNQLFSNFRSVFEQISSEAAHLAPTGAAKVNAIKTALSPHLKRGIAYRKGISQVDYDSFVEEVQDLAAGLEALPEFRSGQGSNIEQYVYDKSIVNLSHDNQATSSQTSFPVTDRDGDIQMSGVNNIQSQLQEQTQLILAALKSVDSRVPINKSRYTDTRPHPPPLSQAERNRRIDANQCERCGKSPSHRWGDCKFRNFLSNPTPRGYSSSRKLRVNLLDTDSDSNRLTAGQHLDLGKE